MNYLILVNKNNKVPDDWNSNVEIINAKNAWNEDIKIEKETYEKYLELKKSLLEDGIIIEIENSYRTCFEQQEIWDTWSNDPEKGIEYVKKFVAPSGHSEHHTGLAIDICLVVDDVIVTENDDIYAQGEILNKVHEKLSSYGFILRYPNGKEDITGYSYEPWHIRYIKDIDIAKSIMNNNMTLEEYYEQEVQ